MDHLSVAPEQPAQLFARPAPGPLDQVRVVSRDDLRRERVTVFFRFVMFLPHLVWLGAWGFAMVLLAPVLWIAALVTGRPPDGLREAYARYLRLTLHAYAFLYLAAEPFPGFLGRPHSYPVDVDVPPNVRHDRWSVAFRLVLALPALVLAAVLAGGPATAATGTGGGVVFTASFLAWFACLARGRMPQGLRDLVVWSLGYAVQAYAYLFLVTRKYPDSDPAVAPVSALPAHPLRLRLTDELRRDRWMVAFRFVLTVPHAAWLLLWTAVVVLVSVVTWLVALVLGRTPAPLHRFLAAYVRYTAHYLAFSNLGGGPFPGFVGRAGSYPVDVEIDGPERQGRWTVAFRAVLVLPALMLAGAIGGVMAAAAIGGWFHSLARGRMPEGLRNAIAFATRYTAQTVAYALFVTPRYPYSGPGDFRR